MEKNPQNKQAYIDTLMMIYDNRILYFGKEGYVLGKKGADLIKYDPTRYEDAYSMLDMSIEMQGNSSEAGALLAYFTFGVSWVIYPFFASKIMRSHYLRRGWVEI